VVVLKTFNNEIEAGMAQQVLQEAGMTAFVFKDDAGGMEPQLQRTNGVRLNLSYSHGLNIPPYAKQSRF
jgi:hypothetical protein